MPSRERGGQPFVQRAAPQGRPSQGSLCSSRQYTFDVLHIYKQYQLPVEKEDAVSKPPVHPGQYLADELKDIGVTPTELARQIDVPPNRLSEIIRGRRSITGDTALRLSHWFGTTPQFWMNLQSAYDIRVAALKVGEAIARLPKRGDGVADAGLVTQTTG